METAIADTEFFGRRFNHDIGTEGGELFLQTVTHHQGNLVECDDGDYPKQENRQQKHCLGRFPPHISERYGNDIHTAT